MMANSRSASASVSAAVGSSKISTLQFSVSALAISTICWLAIGSAPASAVTGTGCRSASTASARRRRLFVSIHRPRLALVSAMKMFSATEMSGQSAIS